jgi:glycosyltransferase involved in cell wall biosynthesis
MNMKDRIDILFIAANARSLVANRGELIRSLMGRGFKVGALVPKYDYIEEVNDLGISIWIYDLDRHSMNLLEEIRRFWKLKSLIEQISPRKIFAYSVKPILFGVIAARLAGVKESYCLVTGLGYLYSANELRIKVLREISRNLYGLSAGLSTKFIFQNPDDRIELQKGWIFRTFGSGFVVNGSGVNLEEFPYSKPKTIPLTFICVARLLREKGIKEFIEAANSIKAKHPEVLFWLLGGLDETLKNSVTKLELDQWNHQKGVEVIGKVKNVLPYLQKSSVMVLPSYYREGTPRSILEAMSVGRPIITCDVPGCRETVQDRFNGFLIPPRSSESLAITMSKFIEQPELIQSMGLASRKMAEEKYDVAKVNRAVLHGMGLN